MPQPASEHQLSIQGMTCAACVSRLERVLAAVPGVTSVTVNLATEEAHLITLPSVQVDSLLEAVAASGFSGSEKTSDTPIPDTPDRGWIPILIAALLALPLNLPMLAMLAGWQVALPGWLQFLLATPVQFWLGARFYRAGWHALRAGSGNMDLLVALGTSAAWGLSVWQLVLHSSTLYFEASATVITLVLFGKWLEARARRATASAIRALAALRPEMVRVRRSSEEINLPIQQLMLGDIMLIRAGERIAADAVVLSGNSSTDESMLTGESMPVDKQPGSPITAGTLNQFGTLEARVTATGNQTVLARIIEQVEHAQTVKPPVQKLADRISAIFVPVVLLIAALTLTGWLLAGAGIQHALLNAVAVLVIACPCALGLATPTAIMAGTGVAARHGILIGDASVLETAHRTRCVAFDKTGTLTTGQSRLIQIESLGTIPETILLQIAFSLQQHSNHPLSVAVQAAAREQAIAALIADNQKTIPGQGVTARINHTIYWMGNQRMLNTLGMTPPALSTDDTTSWLVSEHSGTRSLLATFTFADTLRPEAKQAITRLHQMGIHTQILTGDHATIASRIAAEVGIDAVSANLDPGEKLQAISQLQQQYGTVAMVGDGINDAPALTAADVGLAMASGSDVAMHSAGITLMRPNLLLVPAALDISQRTWNTLRRNLFWAFAYNLVGLPLAAAGMLNPTLAGAAMAFSSVSVVTSALMLKRWKPNLLPETSA